METPAEIKPERRGCLRAFKVGCLGISGLFLLFTMAGTAWFFYMTREVTVHDEDLIYVPTPVPEEENGYYILQPVLQNIKSNNVALSAFELTNGIPSEEGLAAFPAFAEKHPEFLPAFYAAGQCRHYQVPFDVTIPLLEQSLNPPLGIYSVSRYSLCHIEMLIRDGKQEEALQCLKAHMQLGQLLMKDAHVLVAGMFGRAVAENACDLLSHHLSQGTFQKTNKPAIQSVLSAVPVNSDYLQMVRAEYSTMKGVLASAVTNIPPQVPSQLRRYVFNESLTLKQTEHYYRAMVDSFSNPDISEPAIKKRAEPSRGEVCRRLLTGNVVGDLLYYIGMPSIKNAGWDILNLKAKKGLIEVYLALWNYYDEHGTLPTDLELLVPAYLSELPRDPFGKESSFKYDCRERTISSTGGGLSNDRSSLKINLGFVK
ncbi:MAG: hypothetical protein WC334_08945 [Kiritimatiellales bacterium]|jgi:hypothetical protein